MNPMTDPSSEAARTHAIMEALASAQDVEAFRGIMLQVYQDQQAQMDKSQSQIDALRATPATPGFSRIRLNAPDEFHGKREKLNPFLFQMDLKFQAEAHLFDTEAKKIVFVISYLKGEAYDWVIPSQRMGLEVAFPTYAYFRDSLLRAFGDPNETESYERELRTLRQKGSCSEYTRAFLTLSAKLLWNAEALRSQYRQGLSDAVKDQLIHVNTGVSLQEMVDQALLIDGRLEARRIERNSERNLKDRLGPSLSQPWHRRNPDKRPFHAGVAPSVNIPIPMEIDAVEVKTFNKNDQRRMGKCFNCDKIGHLARDCPTKKSKN